MITPEIQKEWDKRLNSDNKFVYIPYDTYVKVQIRKVEEKSKGGIVLVDKAREFEELNTEIGVLIGYGHLAWEEVKERKGIHPQIGDTVIFKRHCGKKIEENGRNYRIMQDVDIYGACKEIKNEEKELNEVQNA